MADLSPTGPSPAVEACKRDRIKEILAYAAVFSMVLVILLVFLKDLPKESAALEMIGGLVTAVLLNVKEVYGFVFGSSQGSQDKTTQLAAQTPPPPVTPTDPDVLLSAATIAASKGSDAFTAYVATLSPADVLALKPKMADLTAAALVADTRAVGISVKAT